MVTTDNSSTSPVRRKCFNVLRLLLVTSVLVGFAVIVFIGHKDSEEGLSFTGSSHVSESLDEISDKLFFVNRVTRRRPSPPSPSSPYIPTPFTPSFPTYKPPVTTPAFPTFPSTPITTPAFPTFPSTPTNPTLPTTPTEPDIPVNPTLPTTPTVPNNPTAPSPTLPNRPTAPLSCNRNLICSGFENCATCPTDCKRRPVICGDGLCVEGENCLNCPSDCYGDATVCCGFGDGIAPEGCDASCTVNGLRCFEEACEGRPNYAARSQGRTVQVTVLTWFLALLPLYLVVKN